MHGNNLKRASGWDRPIHPTIYHRREKEWSSTTMGQEISRTTQSTHQTHISEVWYCTKYLTSIRGQIPTRHPNHATQGGTSEKTKKCLGTACQTLYARHCNPTKRTVANGKEQSFSLPLSFWGLLPWLGVTSHSSSTDDCLTTVGLIETMSKCALMAHSYFWI